MAIIKAEIDNRDIQKICVTGDPFLKEISILIKNGTPENEVAEKLGMSKEDMRKEIVKRAKAMRKELSYKAKELHKAGKSVKEIANIFGYNESSIRFLLETE